MSFSGSPNRDKSHSKPRIYDENKLEIVYNEDKPSRLDVKVKDLRLGFNKGLTQLKGTLQGYINNVIELEKRTEKTILSLVPKNEIFIPNALYAGIVGISGSILTRNRNFLVRTLTPLSLGTLSAYYFIPGTTNNVAKLIQSTYQENRHFFNDSTRSVSYFTSNSAHSSNADTPSELETTINEVQNMYTTRSDPGVRAVLERKNE